MEYLPRVCDGSEDVIADGYWLAQVVGVENEDDAIVPLYSALYSQAAPDFVSENAELKMAMAAVSKVTGGRGVWVIDRGADRSEIYADLIMQARSFVIRQKDDRHLLWGLRKRPTLELADNVRCSSPPVSYAKRVAKRYAADDLLTNPLRRHRTCCGGWWPPISRVGASKKLSDTPNKATTWKTSEC
jgi:hypothetical protein